MLTTQKIIWITLFSIAMGYMETSVVVYLRALYYPDGFMFPLKPIDASIIITELWREAATIIMLAGIGILTGKTKSERFAYFIYSFAIWDIFYYIFLKVLLDWPASLFTWDILFLIPVPWVGPVIAPCITSLTMIILAFSIIRANKLNSHVKINLKEWGLLITGSAIAIYSFILDYIQYNKKHVAENALNTFLGYVPETFNWPIFILSEVILVAAILHFAYRNRLFKQNISYKTIHS